MWKLAPFLLALPCPFVLTWYSYPASGALSWAPWLSVLEVVVEGERTLNMFNWPSTSPLPALVSGLNIHYSSTSINTWA